MLVLLIISMVAAPMLQRGIHLELPATKTATEDPRAADRGLEIDRDGRIQINGRPIHAELLEERMKGLAASAPDETVFLRADRPAPRTARCCSVMDRIRSAGVTRVSLVTVPLERPERR
jgi:biopolymer transport protein ExbD